MNLMRWFKKVLVESFSKFYACFHCKEMIQCIPNDFENTIKMKEFLINHSTHSIALLNKDQLKDFSYKRFREFNYKIQKGNIQLVQEC